MGRPPCCDRSNVKRGPWTPEEDAKILAYVANHGIGNWTLVPKRAGLNRCGKSCRLRWTNYLRPDLRHDSFTLQEEELIINYHKAIGSRWSVIAQHLPGRTDNDVKNYWNTKLKKKLLDMKIDPITHKPFSQILSDFGNIGRISNSRDRIELPRTVNPPPTIIDSPPPSIVNEEASQYMNRVLWDMHSQFVVNNAPKQPFIFNEMASSCGSSSSSSSLTPLSETNPSPFKWNDIITPNNGVNIKHEVEDDLFSIGVGNYNEAASTSSVRSSFVDSILDRDKEMRSQFPDILDSCFDFHDF